MSRIKASKDESKSKFIPYLIIKAVLFRFKIIMRAAKLNKIKLLSSEKILILRAFIGYFLDLIKFSNSVSSESEKEPSCISCENTLYGSAFFVMFINRFEKWNRPFSVGAKVRPNPYPVRMKPAS